LRIFSFLLISIVKILSSLFYFFNINWIGADKLSQWRDIRIVVFLNHTSLFEVLFLKIAPFKFIWKISKHLVIPGADITLNRPILGKYIKMLIPGCLPITRKNDETWQYFLAQMSPESVIAILPEGRMKRKNGLDKSGKPMSVRGGTSDILDYVDEGQLLFIYSGGLHHIQAPGDRFPKVFKTIHVNMEMLTIKEYKQSITHGGELTFKKAVMADLNHRLNHAIPTNEK